MRIVCWQTILIKYHTLFLAKIRKDVANLSSPAVMIGVLRVNGSFEGIKNDLMLNHLAKESFVSKIFLRCILEL